MFIDIQNFFAHVVTIQRTLSWHQNCERILRCLLLHTMYCTTQQLHIQTTRTLRTPCTQCTVQAAATTSSDTTTATAAATTLLLHTTAAYYSSSMSPFATGSVRGGIRNDGCAGGGSLGGPLLLW
jgi:hypothetical protein